MEIVAAAVLGIVQGLTEFLPISSSAHLILVPWLSGWEPEGLVFDISLHVGTAAAVLAYFRQDWVRLAREAVFGILEGRPLGNRDRKLAWCLAVGTLPAVVIGLGFEDLVEQQLRSPVVTVFTLTAFGVLLLYAERRGRQRRTVESLGWADTLWIGFAQAAALIPGVSRSGITISTALLRDFDRPAAARYSFLLATPVIVGAGILEAVRLAAGSPQPAAIDWAVFATGVFCAAATGFLCIRYFLRYLRSHSFLPFVIYRFALAVLVLIFYMKYQS